MGKCSHCFSHFKIRDILPLSTSLIHTNRSLAVLFIVLSLTEYLILPHIDPPSPHINRLPILFPGVSDKNPSLLKICLTNSTVVKVSSCQSISRRLFQTAERQIFILLASFMSVFDYCLGLPVHACLPAGWSTQSRVSFTHSHHTSLPNSQSVPDGTDRYLADSFTTSF